MALQEKSVGQKIKRKSTDKKKKKKNDSKFDTLIWQIVSVRKNQCQWWAQI